MSFNYDEAGKDYVVNVSLVDISCGSGDDHSLIGNVTEYTISNLHEGRWYNISVVINNKAGNGTTYASKTTMETGNAMAI